MDYKLSLLLSLVFFIILNTDEGVGAKVLSSKGIGLNIGLKPVEEHKPKPSDEDSAPTEAVKKAGVKADPPAVKADPPAVKADPPVDPPRDSNTINNKRSRKMISGHRTSKNHESSNIDEESGTHPKRSSRKTGISLRDLPECKDDIARLCPAAKRVDNFVILDCLQRDSKVADMVSEPCQHSIWVYKRNLTTSDMFARVSSRVCEKDFATIQECSGLAKGAQYISCMFEFKFQIKTPQCLMFLNKVGSILFSDYHLIYKFDQKCGADIQKLKCGRLSEKQLDTGDEKAELPSSQGRTIACLTNSIDLLTPECRLQTVRVAELQSDDFHLDRPLFFACRDDREVFCPKEHSGEGRVYKCLGKHVMDSSMSAGCRAAITKRLQLREVDYKIDYEFAGMCEKDVKQYECVTHEIVANLRKDHKSAAESISHVVLCLENVMKAGKVVTAECQNQLLSVRKQLMSDYKITPAIVLHCSKPIKTFCENGLHRNGRTLHCLMDQLKGKPGKPGLEEYPLCKQALNELVKVADAGSDYRVDPVIAHDCHDDIVAFCNDVANNPHEEGDVYTCLLGNMDKPKMTAKCSESLLELQYIVSRDFTLDSQLFQQCKNDAHTICKTPDIQWHSKEITGQVGGLVFSCLVNQLQIKEQLQEEEEEEEDEDERPRLTPPKQQISKPCADQVLRVLRARSAQVMLNPFVYDHCLKDLAVVCSMRPQKQTDLDCLQTNMEKLTEDCSKYLKKYSAEQDRNPSLDRILSRSCAPMIHEFCAAEMKSDPALVMPCLIRHKDHPDMVTKCRAGVEHHQIISLKDFHISTAFRRGCAKDLHMRCPLVRTKGEAVICLSEIVRNATLLGKTVSLAPECGRQVRFENFAKSQDIRLSPRIHRNCRDDVQRHCSHVPVNKQIKCLRGMRFSLLTKNCRKAIFDRTQMESFDSRIDARLQRVCKPMIKHYCRSRGAQALDCLWQHIHSEDFDPKCRRVVYLRLETRVKDYRLDPMLNQMCKRDMRRHCTRYMDPKRNMTGTQYRAQMLTCLKMHFKKYDLSSNCQGYMRQLIVEVNMNHHMDPILRVACSRDVQRLCGSELEETEGRDGDGRVTECLKKGLQANKIKVADCQREVLRLMDESRADVHVDPVLYKACQTELSSICGHVQLGNGRQMSCLLWAKDDKEARKGMSYTCRTQVQARVDMWEKAARAASPNSLHELAIQVNTSESRHYFFAFFTILILIIFIFGLCCGRVTKRLHVDAKNK